MWPGWPAWEPQSNLSQSHSVTQSTLLALLQSQVAAKALAASLLQAMKSTLFSNKNICYGARGENWRQNVSGVK